MNKAGAPSKVQELDAFPGREKRQYLRVPFQYEIRYRKYLKPNQDFKNAYFKNIGMGGALVETYEPFDTSTLLELKLTLQQDIAYTNLSILCKVMWKEEKKKGWLYNLGVAFSEVDKKTRMEIAQLLDRAARSS